MIVDAAERQRDGTWVYGSVSGKRLVGWANDALEPRAGQTVLADMNWNQAFLFHDATGRTLRAPLG